MFVIETESIEAVRSNQKVFDLALKYSPSAVAAAGNVVAIGGEVCIRSRLESVPLGTRTRTAH